MSFTTKLETYEVLKEKKLNVVVTLQYHLKRILDSIRRKISFHQKFRNPWVIEVTEYIAPPIYYELFRAVRDYKISAGFVAETVKDSKNCTKEYLLEFNHLQVFKHHLQEVLEEEIDLFFHKTNSIGNVGCVVASPERKITLQYKVKTGALFISMHYSVTNKYGNLISF